MTEGIADVDVLIVGAGPTGSTLAIDLLRRGHSVLLVDKSPGRFDGSRAKGVQPRTLEVFRDLGVVDAVVAGGSTYPPMGAHVGPLTIPFAMTPVGRPTADIPYPNTWLIPQSRTLAILHQRLAELGGFVAFDTELISVEQQRGSLATATVTNAGGEHTTLSASFIVGCDGASSAVRKSQNVEFDGDTDDTDRIIVIDAETGGLRRHRWHVWPGLGGRFVGACPLPQTNQFQWMIRMPEQAEISLADDDLKTLIATRTGDSRITIGQIAWRSIFRPNIRLARRYRSGRVFLAGDAAHVHTPAGAQGLNTGIQDAYNLGWKMSQVLAGAPSAVLDSYEDERRPIAARVLGMSTDKYQGLARLDPSALRRGDDERQLRLTYRGSTIAPASDHTQTLRVGDRAPNARLLAASGGPVEVFDLLAGPQFTLLVIGPLASRDLSQIAAPPVPAPPCTRSPSTGQTKSKVPSRRPMLQENSLALMGWTAATMPCSSFVPMGTSQQ